MSQSKADIMEQLSSLHLSEGQASQKRRMDGLTHLWEAQEERVTVIQEYKKKSAIF